MKNSNDTIGNRTREVAVVQYTHTQTIYRTTQITTNLEECGPCPVFVSFTLAFVLQLRKKHGKTSVWVAEEGNANIHRKIIVYIGKC
jgi:hypothetical protein